MPDIDPSSPPAPPGMDARTKLAHSLQRTWLSLIANSQNREAEALGPIVEALFENNPREAMRLAALNMPQQALVAMIREAHGLN